MFKTKLFIYVIPLFFCCLHIFLLHITVKKFALRAGAKFIQQNDVDFAKDLDLGVQTFARVELLSALSINAETKNYTTIAHADFPLVSPIPEEDPETPLKWASLQQSQQTQQQAITSTSTTQPPANPPKQPKKQQQQQQQLSRSDADELREWREFGMLFKKLVLKVPNVVDDNQVQQLLVAIPNNQNKKKSRRVRPRRNVQKQEQVQSIQPPTQPTLTTPSVLIPTTQP